MYSFNYYWKKQTLVIVAYVPRTMLILFWNICVRMRVCVCVCVCECVSQSLLPIVEYRGLKIQQTQHNSIFLIISKAVRMCAT